MTADQQQLLWDAEDAKRFKARLRELRDEEARALALVDERRTLLKQAREDLAKLRARVLAYLDEHLTPLPLFDGPHANGQAEPEKRHRPDCDAVPGAAERAYSHCTCPEVPAQQSLAEVQEILKSSEQVAEQFWAEHEHELGPDPEVPGRRLDAVRIGDFVTALHNEHNVHPFWAEAATEWLLARGLDTLGKLVDLAAQKKRPLDEVLIDRGMGRGHASNVAHEARDWLVRNPAGSPAERRCRICGCVEAECARCILLTGEPCEWVEADLCSACQAPPGPPTIVVNEEEQARAAKRRESARKGAETVRKRGEAHRKAKRAAAGLPEPAPVRQELAPCSAAVPELPHDEQLDDCGVAWKYHQGDGCDAARHRAEQAAYPQPASAEIQLEIPPSSSDPIRLKGEPIGLLGLTAAQLDAVYYLPSGGQKLAPVRLPGSDSPWVCVLVAEDEKGNKQWTLRRLDREPAPCEGDHLAGQSIKVKRQTYYLGQKSCQRVLLARKGGAK